MVDGQVQTTVQKIGVLFHVHLLFVRSNTTLANTVRECFLFYALLAAKESQRFVCLLTWPISKPSPSVVKRKRIDR